MAWIGQKRPKTAPNISRSCSVRGSDGCYIGNKLLCFHLAPFEVIITQERVPTSQSAPSAAKTSWTGQKTQKPSSKLACSALAGDMPGLTSVANHSVFIEWAQVKLLVLKSGFLHHKVAPQPQKRPELAKKTPNIIPKMLPSTLSGNPTGVTSAINHSLWMTMSKVITAQEGIIRSQSGYLISKVI